MKERGIMFGAPMVRALLSGRKTQTRRTVKLDPGVDYDGHDTRQTFFFSASNEPTGTRKMQCPQGDPGDRLWVRETWARLAHGRGFGVELQYVADGPPDAGPARYERSRVLEPCPDRDDKWRPMEWKKTSAMFMPRWASRITLEITDVRVQRLQDISEDDAKAEGLSPITKDGNLIKWGIPDRDGLPGTDNLGWEWQDWERDPRKAYARLWDSINGKKAPWASNPFVWSIAFKRVTE